MVETFQRSKDPRLGPGSLWVSDPIPAHRALTNAGQVKASLVLFALMLHSNDRSPIVFPSREVIQKFSGVGKDSITESIKVLQRFGFVKVSKIKTGRTYRNEYEILRACWHWNEFNRYASRYKMPKGHCTRCNSWVYANAWLIEGRGERLASIRIRVHKNCGGRIKDLTKKQMLIVRKMEESGVVPMPY